jgi:hypothetical protein
MVEPFSTGFDHGKMLPAVLIRGKNKTRRKRIAVVAPAVSHAGRLCVVDPQLLRCTLTTRRTVLESASAGDSLRCLSNRELFCLVRIPSEQRKVFHLFNRSFPKVLDVLTFGIATATQKLSANFTIAGPSPNQFGFQPFCGALWAKLSRISRPRRRLGLDGSLARNAQLSVWKNLETFRADHLTTLCAHSAHEGQVMQ